MGSPVRGESIGIPVSSVGWDDAWNPNTWYYKMGRDWNCWVSYLYPTYCATPENLKRDIPV